MRIEALASQALNDLQRLLGSVCLLIGAVGREGIKCVRYRNYARQQRNLVPLEPIWISSPVESFVMKFDSGQHLG